MKSRYQQIEKLPGYIKDTGSGAILNTDRTALDSYKVRKKMMNKINDDQKRISELENKIDKLEALLLEVLKNK